MHHSFQLLGSRRIARVLIVQLVVALALALGGAWHAQTPASVRFIVQAPSVAAATAAVHGVGGTVLMPLQLINGVSARLTPTARQQLARNGIKVVPDYELRSADDNDPYPPPGEDTATSGRRLVPRAAVGATALSDDIDGQGITVAYVDSGFPAMASAKDWEYQLDPQTLMAEEDGRFVVYRDLLYEGNQITNSSDPYGHGTHVAFTVVDSREVEIGDDEEATVGIAPATNVVMVRALDERGQGQYSTVIEAIDWIVAHQQQFKIRVLNLSLDGVPVVPYWYDPLGQAVMRAWQAGIVVVAAAGNQGPDPMTIGVPGNVPYVITVGAIKSGRFTESGQDELARYSSAGPTESKFVKPDVLVPASRTVAALPSQSTLATAGLANPVTAATAPQLQIGAFSDAAFGYYELSGTSMAAAEVSGIVALLLQEENLLTNNQVKQRLRATARLAGTPDAAQYAIWQQGAGRVDPVAMLESTGTDAANQGMDLALDLQADGGTHYMGTSEYDAESSSFYMQGVPLGESTYTTWSGAYTSWAGAYTSWAGAYTSWAGGYTSWAGAYTTWAGGYTSWAGAYTTWAGSHNRWGSEFEQQAEIVDSRYQVFLPQVKR